MCTGHHVFDKQVNKHFHIYAGWFAYFAGLVQCYRGLELVSGTDKLVFSAVEINFTVRAYDTFSCLPVHMSCKNVR